MRRVRYPNGGSVASQAYATSEFTNAPTYGPCGYCLSLCGRQYVLGDGPLGEGANDFGKALVRLREQLGRPESEN
jgi:hypothetical protein